MMMMTAEDRVRDFYGVAGLKEAIVDAFIRSQQPIDVGDVEPDEYEIRQNVEEYFEAVADGSVILSQDRFIEDIPLDILEWRIDGWQLIVA